MSQHNKFAVVDFEATGLSAADRIVEIGVVLLDNNLEVEQTWDTLVQPNREVPNSFVHKLTTADLEKAPTFEGISAKFASLLDGRTVVAHNASFEERFMRQEFSRLGVLWPNYDSWIIDTAVLSENFLNKSQFQEVLAAAGIINKNPHQALSGAMATADLLKWLADNDSDLILNNKGLSICPSGLPASQPELQRANLHRTDTQKQRENVWLSQLVKNLPEATGESLKHYRALLLEVVSDKTITAEELDKLNTAAAADGIDAADIRSLHREIIRQLAIEARMDGVVTAREIKTLESIAKSLNVDAKVVDEMLEQVSESPLNEPLQLSPGDRIALTGTTEVSREEWNLRATAAGLVVGEVAKNTKVLVASDPGSRNSKAQRARELNIPIVNETKFAALLNTLIDSDTNSSFDFDFGHVDQGSKKLTKVFPWFEEVSDSLPTPGSIAQAWVKHYFSEPIHKISPFLNENSTVDIDSEGSRVVRGIQERYPNILEASAELVGDAPGVGKLKLQSVIVSVIYAAIDASEQETVESEIKQRLGSNEWGELAADIYATDDNSISAVYDDAASHNEVLESRVDLEVQDRIDAILHEKYKSISLGLGWIALQNDMVPTKDTIDLPSGLGYYLDDVDQLFENYPPIRMVFSAAGEELFKSANGDARKLAIIEKRWVGDQTLDELGEQFGITRERVRQLEKQMRDDFNQDRVIYDAVLEKIERFIGHATRLDILRDRFPDLTSQAEPFDFTFGQLFTAVGGAWIVRDGWVFSPNFESDVQRVLHGVKNEYGVAEKKTVAEKVGITENLLNEYLARELNQKVIPIGDELIVDAGSHNSRAVALLSIVDEPLTAEEIQDYLGAVNARSASNQYSNDPRIIKVSGDQWGLADWNLPEFRTIASWITELVDEEAATAAAAGEDPQGVSLDYLLSQAERLRIAENSIRAYAQADGLEIIEGQVLKSANHVKEVIGGSIEESNSVYFHDGQWHLLLTVSSDHLRGSGFGIPRGIGNYYEILIGEKIDLHSPLGDVQIGVNKLKNVAISTIRRFLEVLGSQVGDRVWLKFGDDNTFSVFPAPALRDDLSGFARLYNIMGIDIRDENIKSLLAADKNSTDPAQPESNQQNMLAPINDFLGLPSNAPRRRTVSILRHRNQEDLAEEIQSL